MEDLCSEYLREMKPESHNGQQEVRWRLPELQAGTRVENYTAPVSPWFNDVVKLWLSILVIARSTRSSLLSLLSRRPFWPEGSHIVMKL